MIAQTIGRSGCWTSTRMVVNVILLVDFAAIPSHCAYTEPQTHGSSHYCGNANHTKGNPHRLAAGHIWRITVSLQLDALDA
ncbi:uncharacterized protein SCHCODRAFT_01279090 [Schizophyllum commune H4-8]|uniref:uncharacterized protein n=1 Tax=Schizophyllum commune (strain H4-8 / FGSC 9210) TaxID=578458 RepID=UPI00215E6ABF|nr:uncharacterized protein SCHCODRAFT_01279090 [Schizophyllum commune H4-8]KAI5894588.1 hypothetical protein SCHCODRAFT_01279090 [Schizophyllum commune H4-8]